MWTGDVEAGAVRDTVAVPVMDLALGQVYGEKYRISRLLGQGSMGAVYEGENIRIHRKVAIKTLHQGMAEKGDTLARFEREAQAAGRIGSKHICEVLDMGDLPDGSRYMVMEHLEGVTLAQHIRSSGRLKPTEASPIVQQLLDGLGAAHAAQIIHRDLKPANVFLLRQPGRDDFVKILDFGVSKFSVLSEEMSMTRTGAVLGTPYYMSPEQAKGARGTDARSDLYAVGVILYECITGQVPFSAETFNELLFRIVLESPPPAESFVPDLPPEFAALIRKSMAREPADRFQTAEEFKKALADWSAKAAEGSPGFDGLLTLDQQTVMRTAPAALQKMLKPAPPSLTAQGTMLVDRAPSPQPAAGKPSGLAALGTVIIDPAVAGPSAATPAPAPAQRGHTGPTQPLPQWTGPTPPGVPGPPGAQQAPYPQAQQAPYGQGQGQAPYGQGQGQAPYGQAQGQAPYPPQGAGQAYPQAPADPYTPQAGSGPYGFAPGGDVPPPSQVVAKGNAMRTIAFLGIAAGLLVGILVWAMFWRTGGSTTAAPTDATTSTAALTAAPPSDAPAAPSASDSSSAPASAAPSSEPAPSASSTAEPAQAGTEEPVLGASAGVAATGKSSGKTTSTGGSKPGASASATGKPGGKKPPGGRTVSQDL